MDDFYITGIKREKKFEASSKSFTVYVKLDENNNKISYIFYNIDLDGFRWSKGLRPTDDMFEFFIDRIFELMIFKNVYVFKNLLFTVFLYIFDNSINVLSIFKYICSILNKDFLLIFFHIWGYNE